MQVDLYDFEKHENMRIRVLTQHWALLITVICEASFTETVIKPKYVDRFSSKFFRAASDQCTIKFPNFMSILKSFKVV